MKLKRSAGILLHPTSLPGKYGVGDFGKPAYDFVRFLSVAKQTYWQILPLGPTGYGDSPYQSPSSFAGNTILISLDKLAEDDLLSNDDLGNIPEFNLHRAEFDRVKNFKEQFFRKAFQNFLNEFDKFQKNFELFCKEEDYWLNDFSLFCAVKDHHNGEEWCEWEEGIKNKSEVAVKIWSEKLEKEVLYHKFLQFIFYKQWLELKQFANEKGIQIIGDMPFFVSFDSSDVWASKSLFTLTKSGEPKYIAGVPPDYFSATGQLWGNPQYNWKEMESDNFSWWKLRIKALLKLVDIVRIDHFRAFYDYWQIPGDAETAVNGKWMKGPADKFFDEIKKEFKDLPIIAEDLGLLRKEVFELRDKYGLPGMKVLQFAFGKEGEKHFLPHNYIKNCVVYTGTHDNDTTIGWWQSAPDEIKNWCREYINSNGDDIAWDLIKTAYRSVADIAVIPMQDYLRLDGNSRMNFPSTLGGNWSWRFDWLDVPFNLNTEIGKMVEIFERTETEADSKSKKK